MIRLSALTQHELGQVDLALTAIDAAILMLQERGIIDESDGVDLVELNQAVGAEIEFRADEDGRYKVQEAITRGECVPVRRPDGQEGYAPIG